MQKKLLQNIKVLEELEFTFQCCLSVLVVHILDLKTHRNLPSVLNHISICVTLVASSRQSDINMSPLQ